MIRTVSIVPAILSADKEDYRAQVEKVNSFTRRAQIDVTDGQFAPATTLDITNVWWPKNWEADLHLMVAKPSTYLDVILKLSPSLVIMHAESNENLVPIFERLKAAGIRSGLALLPQSYPGRYKKYIELVDHVLVFAGQLGGQGGPADMMQMEKLPLIRAMKPEVEIGWDGGANLSNVRALAHAEVDTIYAGSALMKAPDPAKAYAEMVAEIDKNGVVI